MKYWKILLILFTLAPLGFTISLCAFYRHATQILGYAPHYNMPDPKELAIYTDYAPYINFFAETFIITFLPWLLTAVVYSVYYRSSWWPVVLSAVFNLIGLSLFLSGSMEWYID